jgi:hypothetical protein
MKYILGAMVFASALAQGQSCNIPAGAVALGYTNQLFYDTPSVAEISDSMTSTASKWYTTPAQLQYFTTNGSELSIALGGGINAQAHRGKLGALPYLSGANGFYVEFAMHLSSNDSDHFEGLYLETAEHTMGLDHQPSDPPGYERWTEIDVSESGYGPGSLATIIDYYGISPNFSRTLKNDWSDIQSPFDYTKEHIYGLSWDPSTNVLQWYIDNVPTWKTTPPAGSLIKNYHYYLVMESSSHGSHTPYDTIIRYVQAYTK